MLTHWQLLWSLRQHNKYALCVWTCSSRCLFSLHLKKKKKNLYFYPWVFCFLPKLLCSGLLSLLCIYIYIYIFSWECEHLPHSNKVMVHILVQRWFLSVGRPCDGLTSCPGCSPPPLLPLQDKWCRQWMDWLNQLRDKNVTNDGAQKNLEGVTQIKIDACSLLLVTTQ